MHYAEQLAGLLLFHLSQSRSYQLLIPVEWEEK